MFEQSLKLQETGELMMPADAITTQLYKHQMYALAWMANRENSQVTDIVGGILADDMGLGKTLTVLALILTNLHDKRPLAKPDFTYSRAANRSLSVMRYMPGLQTNSRRIRKTNKALLGKAESEVGAKLNGRDSRKNVLTNAFGHLVPRRKDDKQQVKSSNSIRTGGKNSYLSGRLNNKSAFDALPSPETSDEEGEKDEFDSMCFSTTSSLTERLLGSNDKSNASLLAKREKHFYDGLSDDEEYQNMSEAERNERMKPKFEKQEYSKNEINKDLNLDGMPTDLLSSSEDDDFVSTTTRVANKGRKMISSDEAENESDKDKEMGLDNYWHDFNDLPDIKKSVANDCKTSPSTLKSAERKVLEAKSVELPEKATKNRKSVSILGKSQFPNIPVQLYYKGEGDCCGFYSDPHFRYIFLNEPGSKLPVESTWQ